MLDSLYRLVYNYQRIGQSSFNLHFYSRMVVSTFLATLIFAPYSLFIIVLIKLLFEIDLERSITPLFCVLATNLIFFFLFMMIIMIILKKRYPENNEMPIWNGSKFKLYLYYFIITFINALIFIGLQLLILYYIFESNP
jgi:hypothetical protein